MLLQGLQQDIQSREHMIDSVKAKAQGLTMRSPGSKLTSHSMQIVQRYDSLVEHAKVGALSYCSASVPPNHRYRVGIEYSISLLLIMSSLSPGFSCQARA